MQRLAWRNEQEAPQRTRHLHEFITPAVQRAGWDELTQIREEVRFTKGRIIVRGKLVTRGKAKRADYVLYYKPNIPIAIIEAKDNNHGVGDGMQQGLEYAETLNIPFVFSSNGDGFVFHDRTGTSRRSETNLALGRLPVARPSSGRDTGHGRAWRRSGAGRPPGLLRRRQRQEPALLPAQRHQRGHRSHRQGPGPRPAGHGHRHGQDLHRVPDHLAALEGRTEEAHPLPGRPQRPHRPDHGQRLPALRRGHGEAQHGREDHRAGRRHEGRDRHGHRPEAPDRHRLRDLPRPVSGDHRARRSARSSSASSRPASSTSSSSTSATAEAPPRTPPGARSSSTSQRPPRSA